MTLATDRLWVMADVHGALGKLRGLLQDAGLTDAEDRWRGGAAHLVFLGDYLDRGPDGAGVIRLIRRLEVGARAAGGQVTALLGNHEVMFLAALRFGAAGEPDRYGFREYWLSNGGQLHDAARLEPADRAWLERRPALARVGRWLLLHADSTLYLHLGGSVDMVNAHVARLLQSPRPEVWGHFASAFADRLAFADVGGAEAARRLLRTFGGQWLAHGHTPIPLLIGQEEAEPVAPLAPVVYAGGQCVALDGGLAYWEAAGLIARLNDRGVAEVVPYRAPGVEPQG
ncbi:metallophosphoesterase [Deinococcus sp. YIM 77859]|uniref:metallophosphoesterase n=1 Tax=Deinococcus sp. YIM 77859 TaxID=1540221 RepID=UPI000ABE2254|nr:metallophosphoesterase [Deinococcus sp. YIM 77859]